MKRVFILLTCFSATITSLAQAPQSWTSGQIFQAIKKLNVLGSVLYIAAHPDDENTRLITYLANEKLYRTGYLSLTRGDGGQNLIGDEQGIELGLIRTQELLAARRIDGGEQFFSSAYDFGFSKTPAETFNKWNKEKILSDVVWIIRNFQPDVIITRFPTTGEGGHGHHTASAILANEAFTAAADATKFPEQLQSVQPWQAKRILWNTFNFGSTNTTSNTQFKIDAGGYNPLLGKGYGEIAALSRSQHKSQGFGSAATRGTITEYFKTTGGKEPETDLLDAVNTSWSRIGKEGSMIEKHILNLQQSFDPSHPEKNVPSLVALYNLMDKLPDGYWKRKKMDEVQQLIAQSSGLFVDAFTNQPFAVQSDSIELNMTINNRLGSTAKLKNITIDDWTENTETNLDKNRNYTFSKTLSVPTSKKISQPFWLNEKMEEGHFNITEQSQIGTANPEPAFTAYVTINYNGRDFTYRQPVQYRHTDPVKGEIYDPFYVIPGATITTQPGVLLFDKNTSQTRKVIVQLHPNTSLQGNFKIGLAGADPDEINDSLVHFTKGSTKNFEFNVPGNRRESVRFLSAYANQKTNSDTTGYFLALRSIQYDHIPAIKYFYPDLVKTINIDLKTTGKKIGYITGAGDKIADILEQFGYEVTILDKNNISNIPLSGFDAIITGVRAYNTNEWLDIYYDQLMDYIKDGGNLIVQYNTSSNLGPVRAKIGPYTFDITRNRITDENAKVTILDASHPVFNFPNKITDADFSGWIQERSIYHAGSRDEHLKPLLSMADAGENPDNGSLIVGKYGKGYFTYTGLVFFRQLPAAVPGAIRLMANLIALNQQPVVTTKNLSQKQNESAK